MNICVFASAQEFYQGVDLSYVNELENCDAVYKDRSGVDTDPYNLFGLEGANIVRLRLWHNPQWTNYSNLEDIKISISRAKAEGMSVLLDFHYSDFWADPGRQWRPAAWNDVDDVSVLADSIYSYTYNTLVALNNDGLLPEMVQIGNETNGNILIKRENESLDAESPDLYPINWPRQTQLFNKALDAVNDLETSLGKEIKTVIHIADPLSAINWFNEAASNELKEFDIIGLSYYPQWHNLGVREVGDYIKNLKEQFQKEVMIVEIGYPWTANSNDQANNVLNFNGRLFTYGTDFSVEIQRNFLIELTWLVKENGGLGVIYWEPAWVSSSCQTYWATGSHYENATLFDFEGKLHSGADFLSYDYSQKPSTLELQQVNFIVDMTAIETENGVFVTGDFTGDDWQFMPMANEVGNLYEYNTTIPGRSSGAYIFYNNDVWSNTYMEMVPENCARIWDTHREYWVRGEEVEFYFSWGKCDQTPNEIILSIDERKKTKVYPIISNEHIIVQGIHEIQDLRILDMVGKIHLIENYSDNTINISHLTPGVYILKVESSTDIHTIKFIKG